MAFIFSLSYPKFNVATKATYNDKTPIFQIHQTPDINPRTLGNIQNHVEGLSNFSDVNKKIVLQKNNINYDHVVKYMATVERMESTYNKFNMVNPIASLVFFYNSFNKHLTYVEDPVDAEYIK